ncbi:DUF6504 family protein [Microlunatus sp. Y2014]|uniref:DUF6504 family protein n=1 Tax=Microlunatus sp. Y2014 TaxID=3418488 RepID=UPI003DA7848A
MRLCDEPIDVRGGADGDPAQFLWRDRLWRVLRVQASWTETGTWWDGPHARAMRGDEQGAGVDGHDLLAEETIWRVEAARSRQSDVGVYELAQVVAGSPADRGSWRLRRVLD